MGIAKFFKKITGGKKSQKKKSVKKVKKTIVKKSKKKTPKKISKPSLKRKSKSKPNLVKKEKKLGVVTHYFNKISVGIVMLDSVLQLGDKIHIKGAHDDFMQTVESMQFDHKDITQAKKGLEVGIKVIQPVHEHDQVYKAGI